MGTGARTDQRIIALLEAGIAGQIGLSIGTRSRVEARIRAAAAGEGGPVPSRATLDRFMAQIEGTRYPFGNATTRRTQTNRPNRTWGRQAPSRPGEQVEIGSLPLT